MDRRETEIISGTDPNTVTEIESQYFDVLRVLIDPDLESLKSRITMLYMNLIKNLQSEDSQIRKCKMSKSEYDDLISRIASCDKVIEEEKQQDQNIKKDLLKLNNETDELKKKEGEIKDAITRHKLQINIIEKQSLKGIQEIQIRQENQENQLKKKLDQQNKIKEELQSKVVSLLSQQKFGYQEISQLQKKNVDVNQKIDELREKIKEIQVRDARQKRNNDQKRDELNKAKIDKDTFKELKKQLEFRVAELDEEIGETAETLKESKKNKDEQQRKKIKLQKQKEERNKQFERKGEEIQKLQILFSQKEQQEKKKKNQLAQILYQRQLMEKQLYAMKLKVGAMQTVNKDLTRKKNEAIQRKVIETEQLEKLRHQKEKRKAEINQIAANKVQKQKAWKAQEIQERQKQFQNVQETNKRKKITNEITSYKLELQKMKRILKQIKSEQQKYSLQSTHAYSKYYQTLEQLKANNAQIQNLQKQNQEVENKCKYQQNLYEAVRSDRNLYSKDFLKFKQQISQLKKKYTRMTYAVDQLRQEIKNKDQELVELDKDFKKVESENERIAAENNRAEKQIDSNQEVIKNQQNHVGHLKKIIQEVKQEKAKQQKDYDMIRNQRDILGTQLIKRNHQLTILYDKIKLSDSNLTKEKIHSKEREKELNSLKIKLATLRNQFLSIDDQIRCIDDLRATKSFKEKELLSQKAKIKALEDELQNPMNVHRWRKLQATDQENYQRILKIQTLQRRLIAKTEEVQAKQSLIRQKEKLFLQLKNILARQPGAQIHEQLVKYKQALKQKSGQMKKMKDQLERAHQEMTLAAFEVNRIKDAMKKMKDQYFEIREISDKQMLNERNFAQELMNLNANMDEGPLGINVVKK